MPAAEPMQISDPSVPAHPPDLSQKLPKLGTPRRISRQNDEPPVKPAPPTPALSAPIFSSTPTPEDLDSRDFQLPRKCILSEQDHEKLLHSSTYDLVVGFVFALSDSVTATTVGAVEKSEAGNSDVVKSLIAILDEAQQLVVENPAVEAGGSRFGNAGFRHYLDAVDSKIRAWHARLGLCSDVQSTQREAQTVQAWQECAEYLRHSFGDRSRIDYGSGHELNFVLWLLILRQLGIIHTPPEQPYDRDLFAALALLVFPRYLELMRTIQSTYYLEPAGSHGVWGLDDYQFLPFLFGASQLCPSTANGTKARAHPLTPKSIHNSEYVEEFSKDYIYFDQVRWVNSTKIGVEGLRWHSPMLDDISAAKSWSKIEGGMRKMFLAEVLGKLPVAQHFLFGSILPAADGMSEGKHDGQVTNGHEGHAHDGKGWNDCCGIQVPSAVGAVQEARKSGQSQQLRRLPFD